MQIFPTDNLTRMIKNDKDKRTDPHRLLHNKIYISSKDIGIRPRLNSNFFLLNPNLQFKHSILQSKLAFLNFKHFHSLKKETIPTTPGET